MIALLRLMRSIEAVVPWQAMVALVATVAVFLGPAWWNSLREREIRGLVRRIGREEAVPELTARAFRVAASRPGRVALLASEAHRRSLPRLRDDAWALLATLDPERAGRERAQFAPPPPAADRHPLAAALAIEALLTSGATASAAARLTAARARYPTDPDLEALERRVREAHDAASSPTQTD